MHLLHIEEKKRNIIHPKLDVERLSTLKHKTHQNNDEIQTI